MTEQNQPKEPFAGKPDKQAALRGIAAMGAARMLHLAMGKGSERDIPALTHYQDKYGVAAKDLFWALHGYDERFANTSAPLGFAEMTRILGYAPDAYGRYCIVKGIDPSIDQLKDILVRSYGAADMFMRLSDTNYKTFRTNFGLGDKELADPSCTFEITLNENGELVYIPDPDGWGMCIEEATFLGKDLSQSQLDGCAARGKFGRDVWLSGIDLFCSDPKYFQADLDMMRRAE